MRGIRVYVDTSVVGGVGDEEFAEPSRRFLARVKGGEFTDAVNVLDGYGVIEIRSPAEVADGDESQEV